MEQVVRVVLAESAEVRIESQPSWTASNCETALKKWLRSASELRKSARERGGGEITGGSPAGSELWCR